MRRRDCKLIYRVGSAARAFLRVTHAECLMMQWDGERKMEQGLIGIVIARLLL